MKIIACLPGREYSGDFLKAWTLFLSKCANNGIEIILSQNYSPNIYYVRNLCLAGDIRKGVKQKPFQGKIEYDYLLWIDSDNLPSYEALKSLISRNVDICAGIYKMRDGRFATVKEWDTTSLIEEGEMPFCVEKDLENQTELISVAYTGMGFMLVKNGVFEKLSYPWFQPLNIDVGQIKDFATEDIYFCQKIQSLGYKVYIDPSVRIGHEKVFLM